MATKLMIALLMAAAASVTNADDPGHAITATSSSAQEECSYSESKSLISDCDPLTLKRVRTFTLSLQHQGRIQCPKVKKQEIPCSQDDLPSGTRALLESNKRLRLENVQLASETERLMRLNNGSNLSNPATLLVRELNALLHRREREVLKCRLNQESLSMRNRVLLAVMLKVRSKLSNYGFQIVALFRMFRVIKSRVSDIKRRFVQCSSRRALMHEALTAVSIDLRRIRERMALIHSTFPIAKAHSQLSKYGPLLTTSPLMPELQSFARGLRSRTFRPLLRLTSSFLSRSVRLIRRQRELLKTCRNNKDKQYEKCPSSCSTPRSTKLLLASQVLLIARLRNENAVLRALLKQHRMAATKDLLALIKRFGVLLERRVGIMETTNATHEPNEMRLRNEGPMTMTTLLTEMRRQHSTVLEAIHSLGSGTLQVGGGGCTSLPWNYWTRQRETLETQNRRLVERLALLQASQPTLENNKVTTSERCSNETLVHTRLRHLSLLVDAIALRLAKLRQKEEEVDHLDFNDTVINDDSTSYEKLKIEDDDGYVNSEGDWSVSGSSHAEDDFKTQTNAVDELLEDPSEPSTVENADIA